MEAVAKREKLDVVLNAQAVMYTKPDLDITEGCGQTTEQHEIMLTLGALAEKLGAELVGEASHVVDGLGTIQSRVIQPAYLSCQSSLSVVSGNRPVRGRC